MEHVSAVNKGCEITFVTIIDGRSGMRNWAEYEEKLFWGHERVKWIIFDRSDEPIENPDETEAEREKRISETAAYEHAVELAEKTGAVYQKITQEMSTAECYNKALELLDTPYVCFTNGYVIYEKSVLEEFYRARELYPEEPLLSVDYKQKSCDMVYDEPQNARIEMTDLATVTTIRIFLCAYFIKRELLQGLEFENICEEETGTAFLLHVFKRQSEIVFMRGLYCYYSKHLSRRSDRFYGCKNKEFYLNSLKNIYLPLIESYKQDTDCKITLWMKKSIYFQIYFKYYANLNLRNKFLLDKEETEAFFALTKEILQYIDDDIIMDNIQPEQYAPPFSIRNLFLELKYDCDEKKLDRSFYIDEEKLYFRQCGCVYDLSAHQDLKVMAFNIWDGKLCIDMRYFTHLLHEYDPGAIYAECSGVRYDAVPTGVYALDKVFGESIEKSYTFLMEFPVEELKKNQGEITFWLELGGEKLQMPLFFYRAPSKLNNTCPHTYWMLDHNYILEYKDEKLCVSRTDEKMLRQREKLYVKEAIACIRDTQTDQEKKRYYIKEVKYLRKAYFRRKKKFANRRIWLFFDKLYKAGDNGEYAFRYASSVDDGIECYYVINEDAPEYPRLKAEFGDRILVFNSRQCKLYALFAETIIATHPDIIEFFGYDPKQTEFMRDLFNPNLVCIAHGVTIQKNADYQNRLFDNTMFYTTSSKYEVNHILQPIYGYKPEEVALTGMARFDGLKNNDQKQILITPTWRRNLVGSASRNSTRSYVNSFKETAYYRIYNSLINDERLIQTAEKCGYKIIFLLHPSMSTQIDDYDQNEYVDIIPASGDMSYEKILTESSLMITDYSGIHYDFGYMRKPIIYYQPKEVPMRFEEGGMKFETMGFGPVCTEYEDAVRLICECMENKCEILPEYRKRADDFFAFDDFNNSQRIYDAVKQWVSRKSE